MAINLLEALPSIGKILDDVISTPEEKREAQIRLKELEIRELESKSNVQSSWLSNGSLFVSGAIPSLLWMLVIVIFFNFILGPLLSGIFNISIPILDLPEWYASMCSTIILGLFAKKAYDSTDLSYGSLVKKSKYEIESEIDHKNEVKREAKTNKAKKEKNELQTSFSVKPIDSSNVLPANNDGAIDEEDGDLGIYTPKTENKYDDPEYINSRWEELIKERKLKETG